MPTRIFSIIAKARDGSILKAITAKDFLVAEKLRDHLEALYSDITSTKVEIHTVALYEEFTEIER